MKAIGGVGSSNLQWFCGDDNDFPVIKNRLDETVEVKIKATGDTIEVNADNLIETLAILTTEQNA